MPTVQANGLTLAYEITGSPEAEPLLLITGLGVQMLRWTDGFCRQLVDHGFRVIRFDNRDGGLSTVLSDQPAPDPQALAEALARGERPAVPYTLHDMALDAACLLDALGIARAHVVGRSMGGMIAQVMAANHPDRMLSMTSIMSTTGNPALPPPHPDAMAALTRPAPRTLPPLDGIIAHGLEMSRSMSGSGYPMDEEGQRALLLAEAARAHGTGGYARQFAAIVATGDRRPLLARITAPTLVIHGTDDPLFPLAAGQDTAASIPGAMLKVIEGMGHDLPPALEAEIAAAIAENGRR